MTPAPRRRPRLLTALAATVVLGGLAVPLAPGAAAATGPCGFTWTKAMPTTYALFPPSASKFHHSIKIYKTPDPKRLRIARVIKDPMPDGTRGVLLGVDSTVTNVPGFLFVWYPDRSNKKTGWVKVSDVVGAKARYALQINRASRTLAWTEGKKCKAVFKVAVGAAASQTPAGTFYVNDRIKAPNAAYGHFLLGTDAFSPTFAKFGGLDAAIGIHGTNEPDSIGKAVSHGCIRLKVADSDRIYQDKNTIVGTPVLIT